MNISKSELAEIIAAAVAAGIKAAGTPTKKKVLDAYKADLRTALGRAVSVILTTQLPGVSTPISKEYAFALLGELFNQTTAK